MYEINSDTAFFHGKEIEGRLKGLNVFVLLSDDDAVVQTRTALRAINNSQIFLLTLPCYSALSSSKQRDKVNSYFKKAKQLGLKFSLEVTFETLKNIDKRVACDTHFLLRVNLEDNFVFSKLKPTDSIVFTTADDLLHNVYTLDSVSQLDKVPSHYYSFDEVVYMSELTEELNSVKQF